MTRTRPAGIPSARSSRAANGVSAMTVATPGSGHRSTVPPAARSTTPRGVTGRIACRTLMSRSPPAGSRGGAPRAWPAAARAHPRRNAHGPDPPGRRPAHAAPPAAPSPAAAPAPAGQSGPPGHAPEPDPVRGPGQPRRHHQLADTQPVQAPGQLSDVVLHPPDRVVGHRRRQVARLEHRTQPQHPQHAAHAGRQHTPAGGFRTTGGPGRPTRLGHRPSRPRQPGEQDIRTPARDLATPPAPVCAGRDGPCRTPRGKRKSEPADAYRAPSQPRAHPGAQRHSSAAAPRQPPPGTSRAVAALVAARQTISA